MIETIRLILQLLPAVIRAVKEIEELFPDAGMGPMKLALVREALVAASDSAGEMLPLIEKLISAVVRVFNELGIFKR